MKNSFAPRRAFTLIEILVVIAIIGILSAILFPVLSRARENGRKTACLSNMKQLGLAFQQYAQDSQGKYPLSGNYYDPGKGNCFAGMCEGWQAGKGHWVAGKLGKPLAAVAPPFTITPGLEAAGEQAKPELGALFPYVKSTAVYVCPSNKDGGVKRLTYSMNCAVTGLSTSRVRSTGDIVLLVDEQGANDGYFYAVDPSKSEPGSDNKSTDALTKDHNGGGNLLFVDGHAKFYPFDSFPLDNNPEGLANKWKTGGSPRFHDRAFGPYGSSMPIQGPNITTDYCNATVGPGSANGK